MQESERLINLLNGGIDMDNQMMKHGATYTCKRMRMLIDLKLSKDLFVPKFYPLLFNYSNRWELYCGSAGSAKSYFITQKLIIRGLNERIKILVCRRYGTTLRNSCFALFKEM